MSTRLTHTMTYDAPLADVSAMLDDPAYRDQVIEAQGGSEGSVTVEQTATPSWSWSRRCSRPTASRGSRGSSWATGSPSRSARSGRRPDHADLHVTIPGKPGQMVGAIDLVEEGGTTTETVDAEITVHIPLVSGKLEKLIADLLRKALRAEERVARDYLSG